MRLQDLMTPAVCSCTEQDTLNIAAKLMWENDCGVVPIVDAQQCVVGIVTDRDLCMAAYTQGRPLHEITAASVMSRQVACCHPWDTPLTAEHVMAERRIRRLPIVDAVGKLVGILSLGDLAHCMRTQQTMGTDGMTWPAIAHTLATVSAPRHFEPPATAWSEGRRGSTPPPPYSSRPGHARPG